MIKWLQICIVNSLYKCNLVDKIYFTNEIAVTKRYWLNVCRYVLNMLRKPQLVSQGRI